MNGIDIQKIKPADNQKVSALVSAIVRHANICSKNILKIYIKNHIAYNSYIPEFTTLICVLKLIVSFSIAIEKEFTLKQTELNFSKRMAIWRAYKYVLYENMFIILMCYLMWLYIGVAHLRFALLTVFYKLKILIFFLFSVGKKVLKSLINERGAKV